MRLFHLFLVCCSVQACAAELTSISEVHQQTIQIANTATFQASLECPRSGPKVSPKPQQAGITTEIPDADEVDEALQEPLADRVATLNNPRTAWLSSLHPRRIAIWGDSHMAAGFFGEELAHRLLSPEEQASTRFAHAGIGHGGVRGLVRKSCLSPGWAREIAYAHTGAAAAPGPGMSSLVTQTVGSALALDLRDNQAQATRSKLQILYQAEADTEVAIRIDDQPEITLRLTAQLDPAALVIQAQYPISLLQVRLVSGGLRFQGLKFDAPLQPDAFQIDTFAYPGATIAGWFRSNLPYLASWFSDQHYDLAIIAFGTNEGNDPRFNPSSYRSLLTESLGNFKKVFPRAECVLIGPGDRGIRVAKNRTKDTKKRGITKRKKVASRAVAIDLLKYGRIHAQISSIQAEVATEFGCKAWSMQTAMGGIGSAYRWVHQKPPLMAPDLTHFTVKGYQSLADQFFTDFGGVTP